MSSVPPLKAKDLWLEYMVDVPPPKGQEHILETVPVCGLCGNTGIVETQAQTLWGVACGIRKSCICPKGRAMKARNERSEEDDENGS